MDIVGKIAPKHGTLVIDVLPFDAFLPDGTQYHYEGGSKTLTASQSTYISIRTSDGSIQNGTSLDPSAMANGPHIVIGWAKTDATKIVEVRNYQSPGVIHLSPPRPYKKTTVSYATLGETIVGVDTTGAIATITLATADVKAGHTVVINDEGGAAATNNITLATEGSEKIDGSATATISTNSASLRLYCDGTDWFSY